MKITLEEEDIIKAVSEHLTRQGMVLPEVVKYEFHMAETSHVSLDLHGLTLASPAVQAPVPGPQKRASAAVEGRGVDPAAPNPRALDPGAGPPRADDDAGVEATATDFSALREASESLVRSRAGYVPARERHKRSSQYDNLEDIKDPQDMSDEIG